MNKQSRTNINQDEDTAACAICAYIYFYTTPHLYCLCSGDIVCDGQSGVHQ